MFDLLDITDLAEPFGITLEQIGPAQSVGTIQLFDLEGNSAGDTAVVFMMTVDSIGEVTSNAPWLRVLSDDSGLLQVTLIAGATYTARRGFANVSTFVASNENFELPAVLADP